jgi:hypothetical protein
VSPSQRMRAWGAAVSAGHVVLGTLGWFLLGVPPFFFAGCAALTFAVALLAAPLMRRRPDDGEDGGGSRTPDDGEPPWWPGFEREFREYAASREILNP